MVTGANQTELDGIRLEGKGRYYSEAFLPVVNLRKTILWVGTRAHVLKY
jgi:hypothetical protein